MRPVRIGDAEVPRGTDVHVIAEAGVNHNGDVDLAHRLIDIAVAAVIMVLMFWPQTIVAMEDLNRLILWPATFIQFWAGGRFYRAAWRAGRHGGATMDTLVVVGTTTAWAYSVLPTKTGG